MLKVYIRSLGSEGLEFSLSEDANKMPRLFSEFYDKVCVTGKIVTHQDRYILSGNATGTARLECDLSLEEYEQEIRASFEIDVIIGEKSKNDEEPDVIYILEDETEIDISDSISEALSLALPMKRISPKYVGKELEDLHPGMTSKKINIGKEDKAHDDRWAVLKKIKLN